MLLRRLYEFARDAGEDLPPPMYERGRIRWIVPLQPDGNFEGALEPACGDGSQAHLGRQFWVPYEYRNSGTQARLLADTAEFVLGVTPVGGQSCLSAARHHAFKSAVHRCAASTGQAAVWAVHRFLQQWKPVSRPLPQELNATDQVTFRVGECYPLQLPEVARYWSSVSHGEACPAGALACSVCGRISVARKSRHFKIRRVPGGRTTGLMLVSASLPSAVSYGLLSTSGVPTCSSCEEATTRAANYLLSNSRNSIFSDAITYIFWQNVTHPFDLKSVLLRPEPREIRILEESLFKGSSAVECFDETPFYFAALSANVARVVVRDWVGSSLLNLRASLVRFFRLQMIVAPNGRPGEPIGVIALNSAIASASSASKLQYLIHFALNGGRLPISLLANAVRKNNGKTHVTRARAALIKAVILSQSDRQQQDYMVNLETENISPGYLCGRLLAVLQRIQWVAMGNLNENIVDRFFPMASTSPSLIFPRLMRLANVHLKKARKQRPKTTAILKDTIQELTQALAHFPVTLNLVDQGFFALGYYHQSAFMRSCASRGRRKPQPQTR